MMTTIRTTLILTATLLASSTAAFAVQTQTVATFNQIQPKKGAAPKIGYYKNADLTVTKSVTVKTPVYGPVYDKKGNVIGSKIVSYTSVTTKSTNITPKSLLYTTNGSSTLQSAPIVNFNYLATLPLAYQSLLSGDQSAHFSMYTTASTAPVALGSYFLQKFDSGTISFTRTTPLQFYSPTGHKVGGLKSNLLTINFTNAYLTAKGATTVFSFNGSTPGTGVTYTSDFLNFSSAVDYDFSLAFNAASVPISLATVSPTLTNVTGQHSFNSTRTNVVGTMAASAVPEPAQWSLLIAGFGLVGWRRRRIDAAGRKALMPQ